MGVFTVNLRNSILEQQFAIKIKIFISILKGKTNIFANLIDNKDENAVKYPVRHNNPNNGATRIFDIKNKKEIVLYVFIIIGKIIIFAEILTDNNSFIFVYLMKLNFCAILLLNNTIPSVPKKDNWNPKFKILYGLLINIINAAIEILFKESDFL